MIALLPFSITGSVILLFTLIAFWSRLPGIAIATPLWILYMIDLVDLFSMIVAINVGGFAGAVIAAFCNLVPRIAGITPPWSDVIKDTIIQPMICLVIPFIYSFVQDLAACMVIYTLLRQLGFFIANFVYPEHGSFPQFLVIFVSYTSTQTFINYLYGKYFGGFFDGLLNSGVSFNIWLLLFATACLIFVNGITTTKIMKVLRKVRIKINKKDRIGNKINEKMNEESDDRFIKMIKQRIMD
ncbi:hypothetical protein H6503_06515 [Candidatus Woesearchaeota archaeon]|nr:hypothetical protein [Candidatus Woesearchaeota archaeon]